MNKLQEAEYKIIKETIESFKEASENFFLNKFLDIYKHVIDTFPDELRKELKLLVENKIKRNK